MGIWSDQMVDLRKFFEDFTSQKWRWDIEWYTKGDGSQGPGIYKEIAEDCTRGTRICQRDTGSWWISKMRVVPCGGPIFTFLLVFCDVCFDHSCCFIPIAFPKTWKTGPPVGYLSEQRGVKRSGFSQKWGSPMNFVEFFHDSTSQHVDLLAGLFNRHG